MAYTPPGVTVTEYTSPVISPLLSTSDALCLVGPTPGGVVKQESITLSNSDELATDKWTTTSGWTATTGVTNSYTHSGSGTTTLTNSFVPAIGEEYLVTYTVSDYSAGNVTITFDGQPVVTSLAANGTGSVNIVGTTGTNGIIVTPASSFAGKVLISIKQSNVAVTFSGIPSNGVLQSVDNVVLSDSAPSGNTGGTHYEPFKESSVALDVTQVGTSPYTLKISTIPVAGNPWAVGQLVSSTNIAAGTYVSAVSSNTDGITKTVTLTNDSSAIITASVTEDLYVNGTVATPSVPKQYKLTKRSASSPATPTNITVAIAGSGSVATITLASSANWPSTGYVKIDSEIFKYTANTTGTGVLTLATNGRAVQNTLAATHEVGAPATLFTNAIARTNGTKIAAGDTVTVTYTYVPSDYFKVIELDTMSDVEDRFGSIYNTDGSINSPLSFAAQLAFENGANSVYLQPLFKFDTSDTTARVQATSAGDSTSWTNTFVGLQSVSNLNFIVPVIGTGMKLPAPVAANQGLAATTANVKSIHSKLKDHISYMLTNEDQYIMGIVGHDGNNDSTLTSTAMISNANDLRANHQGQDLDQQIVFVSATKLQRPVSAARTTVALNLGGQYAAVAIAGMAASRGVSVSLTRKNIAGFSGLLDVRTKKEKNAEAAAGLLVLEQIGNLIQVRHSLTTDITGGVSRSEFSVVRAKNFMMASLKNTVDTQIIGNIVADGNAPLVVSTTIASTLERLKADNDIVDYSDVQARTLTVNPTILDVRFNYRPAFPVNYINIGFSVDLSTGNTTLAQANTLQAG